MAKKFPTSVELARKFENVLDAKTSLEVQRSKDIAEALTIVKIALEKTGVLDVESVFARVDIKLDELEGRMRQTMAERAQIPSYERMPGLKIKGPEGVNSDITQTCMFRFCQTIFGQKISDEINAAMEDSGNPGFFFAAQNYLMGSTEAQKIANPHKLLVQFLIRHNYLTADTNPDTVESPITAGALNEMRADKQHRELIAMGKAEIAKEMEKWKSAKNGFKLKMFKQLLTGYSDGDTLDASHVAAVLSHIFCDKSKAILEMPSIESALELAVTELDRLKSRRHLTWADLGIDPVGNFPQEELSARTAVTSALKSHSPHTS